MTVAHRLSNSLSSFRFSLIVPSTKPIPEEDQTNLAAPHAISETTPRTKSLDSTLDGSEKEHKISVVETGTATLNKDVALSPITPWNASFHRNAATTEQETAYLKQSHHLRTARTIISVLLLSFGATMTALNADIIHHYNATRLPSSFFLTLWPTDLNLTPTLLLLLCGAVVVLLSLVYIIVSAIPTPASRSALSNGVFTGLTTLSLPLTISIFTASAVTSPSSIFSTFVSNALALTTTTGSSHTVGIPPAPNGLNVKRDTIQSFTCKMVNSARAFSADATQLKLSSNPANSNMVPTGFGRLCTESRVSYGLVIGMLALEVAALIVVVVSVLADRRIKNLRAQRDIASRDGNNVPESLVGEKTEVWGIKQNTHGSAIHVYVIAVCLTKVKDRNCQCNNSRKPLV